MAANTLDLSVALDRAKRGSHALVEAIDGGDAPDPRRRAALGFGALGIVGALAAARLLSGAADPAISALAPPAPLVPAREPFRIGVPSANPIPAEAAAATEAHFRGALGQPVQLRRFASAARLVDAASAGGIDLAVHTALSFAAVRSLCDCAAPLLRPVAADGTVGLRAVVIVRDNGPGTMDDLAGATVLGAAMGTVAGEIARHGVRAATGRSLRFAGEAPDVALSRFVAGGGAALAGHERIDATGAALGGTMERLGAAGVPARVLWRSGPVWHGPLALGRTAAATRDATTAALLALAPGSPALAGLGLGRVNGFVAARSADYLPMVRLLRA